MGDRSTQTHVDQVLRMRGKCVAHFHRNVVDSASMDVQRFFFFSSSFELAFPILDFTYYVIPFFFFLIELVVAFSPSVLSERKQKKKMKRKNNVGAYISSYLFL